MTAMIDAAGHPSPPLVATAGYQVVGQYLGGVYATNRAYVDACTAAGLGVVSIWEVGAQAALGGRVQGSDDGRAAVTAAQALGQPTGTGIYTTCDFDATGTQLVTVAAYFGGFADAVRNYGYLGGAYGGTAALEAARSVVDLTWQAAGWSNGIGLAWANLSQTLAQVVIDGTTCDIDTVQAADFGAWNLNGPYPPRPAPSPTGDFDTDHMETLMTLAASKQDAFNAQVREWWGEIRKSRLTAQDTDILWYAYNQTWNCSIDLVLANVIDVGQSYGDLKPAWAGAA